MKKLIAFILVLLVLFVFMPSIALAAQFKSGDNISVTKDEKVKNLYTAGASIIVDGDVAGDLVAAGGNLNINGNIENTAQLAGGTLLLKGNVGENVRIAGGTITIDGKVGEDLVVFGGQVTVSSSCVVLGDLIVYAGMVNLNGKVDGFLKGSGGTIIINGTVEEDINIDNADTVIVGSEAVIGGDFNYSSPKEAEIKDGAQIKGKTNYKPVEKEIQRVTRAGSLFFRFIFFLGGVLLLWFIILVAPKMSKNFVENSYKMTWANLGIGFAILVAAPVAMIILGITLIGLPLAGFTLTAYVVFLVLASVLSSLLIGSLFYKLLVKGKEYEVNWKVVLLGVAISTLVKLVPVVGWLLVFGFFLIALGSLVGRTFTTLKSQR